MKHEFVQSRFRFLVLSVLIPFGGVLGLGSWSLAQESSFSVIDSWVENGFEFHVGLEAPPSNSMCSLFGEGLIEFEVAYYTPASSEKESVFGVAKWFPASDPDGIIQTYSQVLGPQGLCTNYSPCRIRSVRVVKTWCPPMEGPLYTPGWD
ncbi:MAG: hypothetical protein AB7T38_15705 [Nitrospirales bacterium]